MRLLLVVSIVVGSMLAASPARAVEECYDFWEGRADSLTEDWYEFYVDRGEWQYVAFAPIVVDSRWFVQSDAGNTAGLSVITRWPYNITSVGVEIMSLGIQTIEVRALDRAGAVVRDTSINYISGNHIMSFDVPQAGLVEIKNTGFGVAAFVRVLVVCVDNLSTPTPQPTRTPTNAPTATPFTLTPTPSRTPTQTRTLFPTVIGLGTLDSGPFRTAEAVSGECRDIRNPCPILPVAVFPTIALPSPTRRPTIPYTATPSPAPPMCGTPNGTDTPAPCSTPTSSPPIQPTNAPLEGIEAISTLTDKFKEFEIELYDGQGTPIAARSVSGFGATAGQFFGILRALSQADFGPATPLLMVIITSLAIQGFFTALVFFIPFFRWLLEAMMGIFNLLISIVKAFRG